MQDSPSSIQSSNNPPKRIKGPTEDAWLKTFDDPDFDRSRLDSRRRVLLNPDLPQLRRLSCYCGAEVHADESWHVMVNDGTFVCGGCARCHCCSREALPNSRCLVSIDGMVLCYRCVKFFGHMRQPKLHMRVETITTKNPLNSGAKKPSGAVASAEHNTSNSEYYEYNVTRVDRCGYAPKEDMRRLFRPRYYDPPVRPLSKADDPCLVAPDYLAENSSQQPMQCPACNSLAVGPMSYVVPSMARVYHRRCFRCCNCKESMAHGVKLVGIAFEYCSCQVPMVWCTRPACRETRFAHHRVAKCRLGCHRPGGRTQMDYTTEPTSDKSRRRKRANRPKKELQISETHRKQEQPEQPEQPQRADSVAAAASGCCAKKVQPH